METPFTDRAECRKLVKSCEDDGCAHDSEDCRAISSVRKVHGVFFATDDPARYVAWGLLSDAVEMCAMCPVAEECLDWAAMSPQSWKHGVYGGLLGSQRVFNPHSRSDANIKRAKEDQEFVLGRVRNGESPEVVGHDLEEHRRKNRA